MEGKTADVAREMADVEGKTADAAAEIEVSSRCGGHHPRCPRGVDSKTVEDLAPCLESGCLPSAREYYHYRLVTVSSPLQE